MEKKPTKILIVDDDEMIRSMYAEVFKAQGFEVEEASDGLEGLNKATKNAPDIIFTGIIMPKMDGFGLKEALDKNVATSNIPVVMSSHMGRKEDQEKAEKLGIKAFIVKELTPPKEVVKKIRGVLGSDRYRLKINASELDAPKLMNKLRLSGNFECPNCKEELVLDLEAIDLDKKEFKAIFVCPKCG